jgi:hypothetical protein
MAANENPKFVESPVIGMVQIATANSNRDGTGTLGDVKAAGADGTRVDKVRAKAQGTTTAGMVRLYLNDGTNTRLWHEIPVSALTPSASVETWEDEIDLGDSPLILPSGWTLKASTEKAETFNVFAHGGDY